MTSFDRDFEEQLKEDVKILLNSYSSIDNLPTLIDKVKNLLENVDQAPSKSMQDVLLPSMKALVTNELFSCILHYWDYEDNNIGCPIWWWANEGRILADCSNIWEFVYLSHVPNCYHTKEVSILDTVAKVRSCLVMLDLECLQDKYHRVNTCFSFGNFKDWKDTLKFKVRLHKTRHISFPWQFIMKPYKILDI